MVGSFSNSFYFFIFSVVLHLCLSFSFFHGLCLYLFLCFSLSLSPCLPSTHSHFRSLALLTSIAVVRSFTCTYFLVLLYSLARSKKKKLHRSVQLDNCNLLTLFGSCWFRKCCALNCNRAFGTWPIRNTANMQIFQLKYGEIEHWTSELNKNKKPRRGNKTHANGWKAPETEGKNNVENETVSWEVRVG